jgi:SAM-dependent methyltransferase
MSQPIARPSPANEPAHRVEIPCPVCDSPRHEVKFEPSVTIDDPRRLYGAASGIPGTQRLVKCVDCAMIYESPRFPEDAILEGYRNSEESGHDSQYAMRVKSFARALKSLDGLVPGPGAKVLDVGTAGGAFLDAAAQLGYDAVGLEPSRFLVEHGKRRGLSIEQGTIDAHPFKPSSFDLVCLWDVLEHVTRPRAALTSIQPLLKPGGVLLINYPDIGTWQAKLAGRRFWWILSVHLHHFSRATIRAICERTGFEAFHFRRYWQTLEFGYLEQMAVHYKIPLSGLLHRATPRAVRRVGIPYYASQTTALARVAP